MKIVIAGAGAVGYHLARELGLAIAVAEPVTRAVAPEGGTTDESARLASLEHTEIAAEIDRLLDDPSLSDTE